MMAHRKICNMSEHWGYMLLKELSERRNVIKNAGLSTLALFLSCATSLAAADLPGRTNNAPQNLNSDPVLCSQLDESDLRELHRPSDLADMEVERIEQERDREIRQIYCMKDRDMEAIRRAFESRLEAVRARANEHNYDETQAAYRGLYAERDAAFRRVIAEYDAKLQILHANADERIAEVYRQRRTGQDESSRRKKAESYEVRKAHGGDAQPDDAPVAPTDISVAGIKSVYETAEAPFQPAIELFGKGMDQITEIRWVWMQPGTKPASSIWSTATNFDGKFVRLSDERAYIRPVLIAAGDRPGTYYWNVVFSTGNRTIGRSFKVTYSPHVRAEVRDEPSRETILSNFPLYDQLDSENLTLYASTEWAEGLDTYDGKPRKKLTCLSVVYAMIEHARGRSNYRVGPSTYRDANGAQWISGVESGQEREPDIEKLEREIQDGNPVILRAQSEAVGPNHFVLAIGIDADGNVVANDPWRGLRIKINPVTWELAGGRVGNFGVVKMRFVAF